MKKAIAIAMLVCTACFGCDSMPKVRVYEDSSPEVPVQETSDYSEIATILNAIGVRFEQWQANKELGADAEQADIIDAYRDDVARLVQENGYQAVDVLKMVPDSPVKKEARKKFLNEHTHSEDEVRFFVDGSGMFYLHVADKVYLVHCEKGDLIGIPANYTHWFDMGPEPSFTAIRFFIESAGWVPHFTESGIADKFPRFE